MKANNGCPFCGCNSIEILSSTSEPNLCSSKKGFQVGCTNCGARGPSGMKDDVNAIIVWDNGDGSYNRPQIDS